MTAIMKSEENAEIYNISIYLDPRKLSQNILINKHIWLNLYGEVTTIGR